MTRRNGRRVNLSTRLSASKQNGNQPSPSAVSPSSSTSPSSSRTRDTPSDEESEWNIHAESEMTLTKMEAVSDEDRRVRSFSRRQTGHHSSLGTLMALIVVHAVLLVAYGVHSRWNWATELVDGMASIASVLFCLIIITIIIFLGKVWSGIKKQY